MENGTRINRELWGSVALVGACYAVLSLASYSPLDRSLNVPSGSQDTLNLGGLVGAYMADALLQGLGFAAYMVPLLLVWMALRLFRREPRRLRVLQVFGCGVLLWGLTILISLVHEVDLARDGGGVLGGFSLVLLTEMFGYAGACAITLFLFVAAAMLLSQTSMLSWWGGVAGAQGRLRTALGAIVASARRLKPGREDRAGGSINVQKGRTDFERGRKDFTRNREDFERKDTDLSRERKDFEAAHEDFEEEHADFGRAHTHGPRGTHEPRDTHEPTEFGTPSIVLDEFIDREAPGEPRTRRKNAKGHAKGNGKGDGRGNAKATAKSRSKAKPEAEPFVFPESSDGFVLPPLGFLDSPPHEKAGVDTASLEANCLVLQRKLQDFGIEGEVLAARPGPVITVYEFRPAPGVMVRRIVGVADDLAMALSAVSIRILAPIPGESVVGIEVPNARREKVFLRDILESPAYTGSGASLPLALGKDVAGAPFAADLARMPHLLVAGATGTGKSVSLNSMILSILYRATPDEVRFIMIDPKMLELTPYEGLPHLLTPVVTDPKEARAALFWAVQEMDRRYRLMRDKGARNIDNYNRILENEPPPGPPPEDGSGEEVGGRLDGSEALEHARLPRVVILIDELADLMMSVGRDIEEYITRLAQKARAAGIHMVLATQRPSVDVITGLIKANFPARVSFQVTSRIDSRTILDGQGAEQLLGDGDLLFLPPGTARLIRLHGPYVSNREIGRVTDFIKQQGKPEYRPDIIEAAAEAGGDLSGLDDDYDEMYDQAVAVVTDTRQASISMIQRRLRVGYNRAARMIEKMEREGVVGPAEGAKPRDVLAPKIEE